jgi:hypothetical protein
MKRMLQLIVVAVLDEASMAVVCLSIVFGDRLFAHRRLWHDQQCSVVFAFPHWMLHPARRFLYAFYFLFLVFLSWLCLLLVPRDEVLVGIRISNSDDS